MQHISSLAGTRLAKAKADLDEVERSQEIAGSRVRPDYQKVAVEFQQAAREVANELMHQGFHLKEGD